MQKQLLTILLCSIISMTVQAQTDSLQVQTDSLQASTVFNGYAKGTDGWFIDLQGGGNYLFNQDVNFLSGELATAYPNGIQATNRFGYGGALAFGKWLSPFLGLRLQTQGGCWKGAAAAQSAVKRQFDVTKMNPLSDGSINYDIFYINPHLDVMFSLASCAKRGWNISRRVDLIPFAGIGFLYLFEANGVPAAYCLTGNFGLQGKCRLTDVCDLNLELSTAIMPDGYAEIAGAVKQADLTLTVGITCNIGGHKFTQRNRHGRDKDTVYVYHNTETILDRGAPTSDDDLAWAAKNGKFDRAFQIALIEFAMGSAKPKQNYEVQYYNVAAFLSAYPNVKIRLDAYCDAKTGSAEYNDELAQRRAENVKKILVSEYGIDPDKIILNPIGSREQVYERTSLNRIVRVTIVR